MFPDLQDATPTDREGERINGDRGESGGLHKNDNRVAYPRIYTQEQPVFLLCCPSSPVPCQPAKQTNSPPGVRPVLRRLPQTAVDTHSSTAYNYLFDSPQRSDLLIYTYLLTSARFHPHLFLFTQSTSTMAAPRSTSLRSLRLLSRQHFSIPSVRRGLHITGANSAQPIKSADRTSLYVSYSVTDLQSECQRRSLRSGGSKSEVHTP